MFSPKARKSVQHRFESEVHVGLLLIIFVLLFVAFSSNLFIYKARVRLTDQWTVRLTSTSLPIQRQLSQYFPNVVPDSAISSTCARYDLSDLIVIAAGPADKSERAKRKWLAEVAGTVPPDKIPGLAERVFGSEEQRLTLQSDGAYSLIVNGEQTPGYRYLVLSARIPELAYFDRASNWILILTAIALLFIGGLYFYLSQFIFRPFRKIRLEAERAGRPISGAVNEAEAVVVEYQKIIDDLHANQEQLLRLNAEVSRRAESLEQFNDYILSSTQSGALTIDMSGKVLAVNDAAMRLIGAGSDSKLDCSYTQLISPNHPLLSVIESALAGSHVSEYQEMVWEGKSVGVGLSLVKNAESKTVGLWVLLFDLSETARLRTELEDRKRLSALGEMAGGLAHQLRNSIGAIAGYARLLQKKVGESSPGTAQAESLLEETRQADQLIKRFLSFSRPLECELVDCTVAEVVSEVVDSMRVRPDFGNINLTFSAGSKAPITAAVDPLLFKQVLSNLIENAAWSYADRSGTVDISVTQVFDEVSIEVRDRGCGIPPDKIDKVFTPFYSGRPDGTGLGLSLAARIIGMHHGTLCLTNRDDGGVIAAIRLPIQRSEIRRDAVGPAVASR